MSKLESSTYLSIVPATLTPKISGFEKSAYGALDALGRIANIICISDTRSDTKNHTFEIKPLLKPKPRKYFSYRNYQIILNQVKLLQPKSILLEQPFLGIIIYWISRKTKTPYFVHAHSIEFLKFKSLGKFWWPAVKIIEKFTLQRAKGVFFLTQHDKNLAIKKLGLTDANCFVTPYGIPQENIVKINDEIRNSVRSKHGISPEETVFMFLGVLKYMPNIEALELIIQEILPRLIKKFDDKFKILVCGSGISDEHKKQLERIDSEHFIYAGFVENIDEYTQSADVILNPMLSGGGIKTIIVEALGFNKCVVSTKTGAIGVDPNVCNTKLYISDDNDWDKFINLVIDSVENKSEIPPDFYKIFSWRAIAQTILKNLAK